MKILKSKQGFSELISTTVGLLVLTIMLIISITFIGVVNYQSIMNEFANQMIFAMCDYGMTDGTEIDERYEELENSLNISPEIEYSANYISGKNVQYGDLITITVKSERTISILGFDKTMYFEIEKTGLSKQYWK